jgi:hypothetical protein
VQHDDLDAMRELVRSVSAIGHAVVRGVRRGLEEPKPAGA